MDCNKDPCIPPPHVLDVNEGSIEAQFFKVDKLQQVKIAAKLAWGVYYPTSFWTNNLANWIAAVFTANSVDPDNYPACYGKSNGNPNSIYESVDRAGCADRREILGLEFQGHIKVRSTNHEWTHIKGLGWIGHAEADIYHLGDLCYVAIRGTDWDGGMADHLKSDVSFFHVGVQCDIKSPHCNDGGSATTRKIARGMVQYYTALRDRILKGCAGKTIVATGHSLGGAAVGRCRLTPG